MVLKSPNKPNDRCYHDAFLPPSKCCFVLGSFTAWTWKFGCPPSLIDRLWPHGCLLSGQSCRWNGFCLDFGFFLWMVCLDFLGGGFKYFLFSPLLGEMIHFDEHIFQMGWKLKPPTSFSFGGLWFNLCKYFFNMKKWICVFHGILSCEPVSGKKSGLLWVKSTKLMCHPKTRAAKPGKWRNSRGLS